MSRRYTPKELAGLPGMPTTERGVNGWGEKGVLQRHKRLKGKGWEYEFASLPEKTQEAIEEREAIIAAQARIETLAEASLTSRAPDPREEARAYARTLRAEQEAGEEARRQRKQEGMKRFASLPADSDKRLRAKARESLLLTLWDYQRRRGLTLRPALAQFAELANAGEVALPDSVWQWMPHVRGRRALSAGTIKRWHYDYRAEGIWGLVDGYGARKGQSKVLQIDGLADVIKGLLLEQPHITPKKVKQYVAAKHPEKDLISLKSYERFMKQWKSDNAQAYTYATNPDAWKNQYMAAVGSHHERVERLNQVWELDSTPGDWLLSDGRHSVIGCIDLYSRRFKLYVSKSSTAMAVCQVYRRSVLAWGINEIARTDNGKDYVSHQFTSVLRDLEVDQELCAPFASEEKGTVERAFRTMSHGILDLLPGFIGHNVAERKVIEARKSFAKRIMTPGETVEVSMSSDELQKVLDQWCQVYHHTPHSGLENRTPFEVATNWTGPVRRITDERALDLLLAEVGGTRVIGKKGLRFEGHLYDAPELFEHVGREAVLKRDESDIGRLYVYVEGEFVAIAECAELLGISRQERAAATKAAQKRFLAVQQKEFKRVRKDIDKNIGQTVLDYQLAQIENVEALPRPSEEYAPNGLREAGRAARADLPPQAEPLDGAQDDARQQLAAELAAANSTPTVLEADNPKRRYQRWVRLDQRVNNGERLAEGDQKFHNSYRGTDEYRSMKGFFEDFNLDVNGY
ncbi:DDE-type integrase/transposase/recombinase [Marinobacter subterrani]|uniref:Mu transposase, C-terminal/Mu DNA-binding domain/Integrase core domain n=1 Tax=Marinobacter subterrani TaxID=1658765 RepID=A0A0J7LYR3_9GAMM|nr:DDE-type integrase/transposase/recombinase [Marinobacter subterrani]KMQ74035.1 Mu transposase, C-terminal/Mu DNA-binding domain/Integrase core domain [Marinobacter subterrani]